MNGISELCKLLHNPLRLEILRRVYDAKGGVNVGYLADEFTDSGLGLSGVSQYLKQLERIGVVKRERAGRTTPRTHRMRRQRLQRRFG